MPLKKGTIFAAQKIDAEIRDEGLTLLLVQIHK